MVMFTFTFWWTDIPKFLVAVKIALETCCRIVFVISAKLVDEIEMINCLDPSYQKKLEYQICCHEKIFPHTWFLSCFDTEFFSSPKSRSADLSPKSLTNLVQEKDALSSSIAYCFERWSLNISTCRSVLQGWKEERRNKSSSEVREVLVHLGWCETEPVSPANRVATHSDRVYRKANHKPVTRYRLLFERLNSALHGQEKDNANAVNPTWYGHVRWILCHLFCCRFCISLGFRRWYRLAQTIIK